MAGKAYRSGIRLLRKPTWWDRHTIRVVLVDENYVFNPRDRYQDVAPHIVSRPCTMTGKHTMWESRQGLLKLFADRPVSWKAPRAPKDAQREAEGFLAGRGAVLYHRWTRRLLLHSDFGAKFWASDKGKLTILWDSNDGVAMLDGVH